MTAKDIFKHKLSCQDGLMFIILIIVYYLLRGTILPSDSLLAWPITDSIVHPGKYSPEDLIVRAGSEGNFLLYRLLAMLPFLRENLPLRDFLIYFPLFFLYLIAWWYVFSELGASRMVAMASTVFLLFSDGKLGLNWSQAPMPYLISSSSVQFLQVFGLYLFFARRRILALGLTGATGYFHPAMAFSFGTVYSIIICLDAIRQKNIKLLYPVLLFTAVSIPNILIIILNSQGAFSVNSEYFNMFNIYLTSAFLKDHFRMGYAYTLTLVVFLYRFFPKDVHGLSHRNDLFLFIGAGLAVSIVWLINLYTIKQLQVIHLFFIMRIFCLIKGLVVFLTITAALRLYQSSKSIMNSCIVVMLLMTLLMGSPSASLIVVIVCATYATRKQWWPILFCGLTLCYVACVMVIYHIPISGVYKYIAGEMGGNELNLFQGILLFVSCFIIMASSWNEINIEEPNSVSQGGRLILALPMVVLLAIISRLPLYTAIYNCSNGNPIFSFYQKDYWGVRYSDPAYAELLDWAQGSPEKLFSVPPYDDRFINFRYLSGKGIYVFHRDIGQLMYSPNYFYIGVNRIRYLGGDDKDLPKAFMYGKFRGNGIYEANCRELIASDRFDVVIFEKKRLMDRKCTNQRPVFENEVYIAYKTPHQSNLPTL